MLHGVVKEVEERLRQQVRIDVEGHRRARPDRESTFAGQETRLFGELIEPGREHNRLTPERLRRIEASEGQQLFGEAAEPSDLALHALHQSAGGSRIVLRTALQHVERAAQRREGRAQFVRGGGDEPRLAGEGVLDVRGHVVERSGQLADLVVESRQPQPLVVSAGRHAPRRARHPSQRRERRIDQPTLGPQADSERGHQAGTDPPTLTGQQAIHLGQRRRQLRDTQDVARARRAPERHQRHKRSASASIGGVGHLRVTLQRPAHGLRLGAGGGGLFGQPSTVGQLAPVAIDHKGIRVARGQRAADLLGACVEGRAGRQTRHVVIDDRLGLGAHAPGGAVDQEAAQSPVQAAPERRQQHAEQAHRHGRQAGAQRAPRPPRLNRPGERHSRLHRSSGSPSGRHRRACRAGG